jgi:hypothetical protein
MVRLYMNSQPIGKLNLDDMTKYEKLVVAVISILWVVAMIYFFNEIL